MIVMVEVLEQTEEEEREMSNVEERSFKIDIISNEHIDCFRHFILFEQNI